MTAAAAVRVPPGRAGILLLRRRLAVAEAGADLLARKLTVLSVEAVRLETLAVASGQRWRAAAREAQRRADLAGQVSGDLGIRLAALPPLARSQVRSTTLMGLRYPAEASCELLSRPPDGPLPGSAALMLAERAIRAAVPAAAEHAAAIRAAMIVHGEVELTRRRLRALEHRRIPGLRQALVRAVAQVEELEAADTVLRRWATEKAAGST